MSLEVKNLTKVYDDQKAVDNASFRLKAGEIVGFLGPNGAGKTTTMKMLTSYIPPTSGEAYVMGKNVAENPLETKSRIGYLPEHNPLYGGMYVREFLYFIARLHGLSNRSDHVDRVVELTGLKKEQHKLVRALSKGYRQRLGLAQALIHDPQVLILDEPTSGLDPNQLVEIRSVIRTIGKKKTILFSSHIMQEVQALCERVIIIHEGKIVADGLIDELDTDATKRKSVISVRIDSAVEASFFKDINSVINIEQKSNTHFHLTGNSDKGEDLRMKIYDYFRDKDVRILEMQRLRTQVEDVFQNLTRSRKSD